MEPEVRLRHAKLLELLLEPGLRPHDAAIGGEQVHHVRVNLERENSTQEGILDKYPPPRSYANRSCKANQRGVVPLVQHTWTINNDSRGNVRSYNNISKSTSTPHRSARLL